MSLIPGRSAAARQQTTSRPGGQDVRDRRADHRAGPGIGADPAEDRAGQGRCAGKPAEMIMSPPAAREPIARPAGGMLATAVAVPSSSQTITPQKRIRSPGMTRITRRGNATR